MTHPHLGWWWYHANRQKASQTKTVSLMLLFLAHPLASQSVVFSDVAESDEGFEKSSITKHSLDWNKCFQNNNNTFYQGGSKHNLQDFTRFYIFTFLFFYWIIHFICINFYLVLQHYLECLWPRFLSVFSFVTKKYLFPYIGDSNEFWDLPPHSSLTQHPQVHCSG